MRRPILLAAVTIAILEAPRASVKVDARLVSKGAVYAAAKYR